MMNDKRKYLIFILILIAFVSIGGVSANTQDNTTGITNDDVLDDSMLIEDSLDDIKDEQPIIESVSDFNDTLTVDNSDNTIVSYSQEDSSDDLVLGDNSVLVDYVVNSPIVNPNFEDGLNGWTSYGASITEFFINAKSGTKFVSLSNNAYISQSFNLDTIDSVSFWYMSNTKGSTINIFIDDVFLDNYTIQKTGLGKQRWEEVKLDLVNYMGYHTLYISQSYGVGYLDYFNCNYNNRIVANFTIPSWNISEGYITINFEDFSQGLISNYIWDFGDGNSSTEQNPIHTFKLNHYTVTLMVSNEYGNDSFNYVLPITLPTILRSNIGYSTIQEAINNALDGDVISITSNYFTCEYFENLVIDKSLILDFNNCTLKDCNINVVNGANAVINNISFTRNNITTDADACLIIQNSFIHDSNIYLADGNIILKENMFSNSILNINANASIIDSNISSSTVNVVGGKSNIVNNIFNSNVVAINQSNGKSLIFNNTFSFNELCINVEGGLSNISRNIINDNDVGVNVIGGDVNLLFNTFYFNKKFGLIHSIGVVNENNWWATNNPTIYSSLTEPSDYYDVYYIGDNPVEMKYLVLNITQSSNLDLKYWIGGITYYNITIDLAHNNIGEDTSNTGSLKSMILNFNINDELKQDLFIKNEVFDYILTFGYMSGYLSELTFDLFNVSYAVPVESDSIEPVITFMTPTTNFKDSQLVEIECDDENAVIFYTLDGSNPCFSPTRLIYANPISINETVTVHATAIDKLGNCPLVLMDTQRIIGRMGHNYNNTLVPYIVVKLSGGCMYTFDGSQPVYYNNNYDFLGWNNNSFRYTHLITITNVTRLCVINPEVTWMGVHFSEFKIHFYNPDCHAVTYIKEYNAGNVDAIWSQYQGNSNHAGVSNYTGPSTNSSKWSRLDISSSGSPVIDKNGHIYIGGDDGYLYCLNNQGNVIWRYGTSSKILCTPTIGNDGNIYLANWMNSTAYCISPDGQLIWKYFLGDYNTGASPVFGVDEMLYFITTTDEGVSKIHLFKDNHFFKTCLLPVGGASTPVVSDDGSLYMVSLHHDLIVVNWDGSLKYYDYLPDYVFQPDSSLENVFISVSIDDGGVFYIIEPPFAYAETGQEMTAHFLRAYNSDGSLKWMKGSEFTDKGDNFKFSGTPSYYNGVLYVAGGNRLIAVNASNGITIWETPLSTSGSSLSSPLISGDELIYVSKGNVIYAFDLNGNQLWNYTLHGKYGDPVSYSSPVLSNDGTLIVSTNQGIFAFHDIVADFKYAHINGTERGIQFSDLSTEGNNSYLWIFGDNATSFEQNPIHHYACDGKYRVVLIVDHDGTMLARNMTISVVTQDITPPSDVSAFINNSLTYGGVYPTTQVVLLNASDDLGDIVIYYTLDGSNPLNSSTRKTYIVPVEIEANAILKAVAVDDSLNVGNVSVWNFIISDALNVDELINSSLIQKIQNLLDEAEAGSKFVFDYPVLYGANFTINKPLNLVTTTNTKLVGNGAQPVFTFAESAKGSSINGFDIENDGAEGILIKNTDDVTIKGSNIDVVNSVGINIINSTNISVRDTSICNAVDGILINQSQNTNVNRVNVADAFNNGIWVLKSQNTLISNSFLDDNGKDPYGLDYGGNQVVPAKGYGYELKINTPSSVNKANQVLIDYSKGTYLYNNTINEGYFGVHLYHENHDVVMDGNEFLENVGDAILLSNDYYNVNITHNLIDGSYNGIDFMGYSVNVVIKNNVIENLHSHDNDLQTFVMENLIYSLADYVYETHFPGDQFFNHCYNGIQVSYPASNFDEGNTVIIDNVVIKLQHRSWEARKYQHYLNAGCDDYGYNMMDGSDSYHGSTSGATHYNPGKVDMVVDRIGDATYRLRLINCLDNHYLTDLPAFDVTFTTGSYTQTVQFKGSEAIATFDVSTAITTVTAIISAEIKKSVSWNIKITEGYKSSNRESDPGYEAGEAVNNPDPVIPTIDEYIRTHSGNGQGTGSGTGTGNGNGNGQGTGTGNGQGSGNGHGSSGHGGSNINGREGEIEGNANNLIQTNGGTSPSVGVEAAAEGDSDTVEGGSESGGSSKDSVNAYEVSKVININENNWQSVQAVILFSIFIILGYGYRRGKKDGDEI